jgi:surface protein
MVKKGISAIVAIIFFVLFAVVFFFVLQTWFLGFTSDFLVESEIKSDAILSEGLELNLLTNEYILLKNDFGDNLSFSNIYLNGNSCNISGFLDSGLNRINISSCLNVSNKGVQEIKILSKNGIFVDNLDLTGVDIVYLSCFLDGLEVDHLSSGTFFNTSLAIFGSVCHSQVRNCNNGVLDGDSSFVYSSCNISTPIIPSTSFLSLWNTSKTSVGSSNSNQIALPLESSGSYNFTIDWGDGNTDTIITWNQPEVTHTYASEGEYTINITGEIRGFRFNYDGDRLKILDVMRWGDLNFGNNGAYFYGATNFNSSATDSPNLTGTTNLSKMFAYANSFNGDLSSWDTSSATDMSYMFEEASNFNGDISSWDMRNVETTRYMFSDATAFNRDINSWNTTNIKVMSWMFSDADSFNQDLDLWDVSNVQYMDRMFRSTPFNSNISNWDVSSVVDMAYMFQSTPFNQDISSWNMSNVKVIRNMFFYNTNFNQDLNSWDTSNIEKMNGVFWGASNFEGNISLWNTSNVNNMNSMFDSATSFNGDISNWDVSNVTIMGGGTITGMFAGASSFNQDLSSWDVSSVTNMANMFYDADSFNQDLNNWNTSSVIDMSYMFANTDLFDGNISSWDVSNVDEFYGMFYRTGSFNQDIGSWDVSAGGNFYRMFADASSFNQDISSWNFSVTSLRKFLQGATSFNQDLSSLDVSGITLCSEFYDNTPAWVLPKPNFTSCTP